MKNPFSHSNSSKATGGKNPLQIKTLCTQGHLTQIFPTFPNPKVNLAVMVVKYRDTVKKIGDGLKEVKTNLRFFGLSFYSSF